MRTELFIISISCMILLGSCQQEPTIPLRSDGTESYYDLQQRPFYHGVASGDPLPTQVIIWTRVTPSHHHDIRINWEVATDSTFSSIVQKGQTQTDSTRDYTVKVDVGGLQPNTAYAYRFTVDRIHSPIGFTRTTPTGKTDAIRLGVVSCSNLEFGYFSAYRHLATKPLHAVVHLGDYFYEYAPGTYGDTTLNRKHIPPREIVSLSDYRTRYAQYRLDRDLLLAHRMHPFITVWDDHEITNNSYQTGAQNHQADEGSYEERKRAAKQAYYEWMPVRPEGDAPLYRTIDFGGLADLILLDERLAGRSKQAESFDEVDSTFTMLGPTQLEWFKSELSSSQAVWKIIGNQVIYSPLDLMLIRPASPRNLDAWDGYAVERDNLTQFITDNAVSNVIFVTGDTHTSWAFEVPLTIDDYNQNGTTAAVEFGTTSITSANWNERNTDAEVIVAEGIIRTSNPHLKFVNGRDHGYMILTITPDEASATWYYMDDIRDPASAEKMAKTFRVEINSGKLMDSE